MSETPQTSPLSSPWDALARQAADTRFGEDVHAETLRQLLVFLIDGSSYAVPVESVREIVRVRPITPIPRVTRDVRGVISLRGEILQVIDLRLRLGLPPTEISKSTRIVVVHGEDGGGTGVLVDQVREVLRVSDETVGAGAADSGGLVEALQVHGEEFISLVDLSRVLDVHDGE